MDLFFWSTLIIGFYFSNIIPSEIFSKLSPSLPGLILIISPFVYLAGLLIDIFGNKALQWIKIERNLGSDNYNKIIVKGSNSANDRVRGFESTKRFLRISFVSFSLNLWVFLILGCITKQPLIFYTLLIVTALGLLSFIGYILIKEKYEDVLEELS